MIRLYALGSGSGGNAFAVEAPEGYLLVDAGFSAKEIERRARGLGLAPERMLAIALTHEHGDHTAGAVRLARKYDVPVLATPGTLSVLARAAGAPLLLRALRPSGLVEFGPFSLGCSPILHDAAEPVALAIECANIRLGVAYDFGRATGGLRYLFRDMDAVVVEANYDELLLRTSDYPPSVQHRIAGSGGHLSNRGTAELLRELFTARLRTVVLAHLSQRCNTPEVAVAAVRPALEARGFRGRLEVALQDQGLGPLDLTKAQGELFSGSELSAPCPDPEEPGSSPGGAWAGRFAGG